MLLEGRAVTGREEGPGLSLPAIPGWSSGVLERPALRSGRRGSSGLPRTVPDLFCLSGTQ